MKIEQFVTLRKKTGISQEVVAQALGLTNRAIARWETKDMDKSLAPHEATAMRELFRASILEGQVRKMVHQAFDAIPSELVNLWLVDNLECILLPNTTRQHYMEDLHMPLVTSPLAIESLTTYPVRSGEPLNLAGDAIVNHQMKKYKKNRASHMFKDGQCESLLHVPAFIPSIRGPQPVLLLSFENKMDENGKVIMAGKEITMIYSADDSRTATHLAEEFRDRLLDDMKLLDMIK